MGEISEGIQEEGILITEGDLFILFEAGSLLKKEFPKKLPEKNYKIHRKTGKDIIEVTGALVNEPEEYFRELKININGKRRKFKIILRKEEPQKKKTFIEKMEESALKQLDKELKKEEKKKSKPSFFTKISKFLNFD